MLSKILFVCLLLAGCSSNQTVIEEVTTPAIKTIEEALDYSKNNIEETDDTRFLNAHLEACHGALISCETVGKQALENKALELKHRDLMIIIVAVLAFIFGRVFRV